MASKNKLLGSGKPDEVPVEVPKPQAKAPAWRYHSTCPQGVVVKTDLELARLDAEGWVDHPGKVRALPGWTKLAPAVSFEELAKQMETPTETTSKIDVSGEKVK